MNFKKMYIAATCLLLGCSSPAQAPVVAPEKIVESPKPELKKVPIYVGDTWQIDLGDVNNWEKLETIQNAPASLVGNWISKRNVGLGRISLSVLKVDFQQNFDANLFVLSILNDLEEDSSVKVFNLMKLKSPMNEAAVLAAVGKKTTNAVVGRFLLVKGTESAGYVVACGGLLDDVEEWKEECLGILSSFSTFEHR
jgi:hypothetical protein